MKKLLPILLIAFAGFGCSSQTDEPMYNKVIEATYNYNVSPTRLIEADTISGSFNIRKDDNTAYITDSKSNYAITLKQGNPNSMVYQYIDKKHDWTDAKGYKIRNSMSGDTLLISYLPDDDIDQNVLKFGFVYKFYK